MMQNPIQGKSGSAYDNRNLNLGTYRPEVLLTIRLVLTARRWRTLMDEHLRKIDQSAARMEAMSAIRTAPGPNSQIEIAKRLRIEGPTMTRMIDTLARDGLVERAAAPTDRRTKYLSLTEAGERELDRMLALADQLRDRLLQGVTAERVADLNVVFEGLLDRLDAGLPECSGESG